MFIMLIHPRPLPISHMFSTITCHLESSNSNSNSLAIRVRDAHTNLLNTSLLSSLCSITMKLFSISNRFQSVKTRNILP